MTDKPDLGPIRPDGSRPSDPLPREWLPGALPPEDDPVWALRVTRILAAAEPVAARLSGASARTERSWWMDLGAWWKPAAALAAAAVGLLFLVPTAGPPWSGGSSGPATALKLLVAEGDPSALWTAFGVPADPVLAMLVLEDSRTQDLPARTSPLPEEDR